MYLLFVYFAVVGLMALSALFSALTFSDFQTTYPFLRKLIDFIHTPLPFLIVSISFYGYEKLDVK